MKLETLKSRSDFLRLNRQGRKCAAHGLVLQAMENGLGHSRIGYTVTKKTENSAVKRNRAKRRLRAAAAEILPLHAAPGCDYVLIGRAMTRLRPFAALCGDLRWCLEKLGYAKNS